MIDPSSRMPQGHLRVKLDCLRLRWTDAAMHFTYNKDVFCPSQSHTIFSHKGTKRQYLALSLSDSSPDLHLISLMQILIWFVM